VVAKGDAAAGECGPVLSFLSCQFYAGGRIYHAGGRAGGEVLWAVNPEWAIFGVKIREIKNSSYVIQPA
jgi:hypothetical protein